ncbi:hypothetical protein SISSUDRAFT_523603 [Sistotremastrum suecicum HHB10207 ss-3]|uniref:Zn(2)-C6 fungal-type domain-containing protein n=1 Tax=Sistotremastrum suecicum HHB10207 ss-3 TaxID=1314776 RepID=A0A165XW26_9AGAM|nr:hypothetical protein SISSUDRAFT_523603 [Sistotremastrum suecicum HHB10207 ss-3]
MSAAGSISSTRASSQTPVDSNASAAPSHPHLVVTGGTSHQQGSIPTHHQQHQQQHPHPMSNNITSSPNGGSNPTTLSAPSTKPSDPNVPPAAPNTAGGSSDNPKEKQKDKRERLSRACIACHAGKTKCSDSLPCEYCIKKGIADSCAYPEPDSNKPSSEPAHRRRGPIPAQPANVSQTPVPPLSTSTPPSTTSTIVSQQPYYANNSAPQSYYYEYPQSFPPPAQNTNITSAQRHHQQQQQIQQQTLQQPHQTPNPNGHFTGAVPPQGAQPPPPPHLTAPSPPSSREPPEPSSNRPSKRARHGHRQSQPPTQPHDPSYPSPHSGIPMHASASAMEEDHQLKQRFYRRGKFFVGDSAPVTVDPALPLRLVLSDSDSVDFFIDGHSRPFGVPGDHHAQMVGHGPLPPPPPPPTS